MEEIQPKHFVNWYNNIYIQGNNNADDDNNICGSNQYYNGGICPGTSTGATPCSSYIDNDDTTGCASDSDCTWTHEIKSVNDIECVGEVNKMLNK